MHYFLNWDAKVKMFENIYLNNKIIKYLYFYFLRIDRFCLKVEYISKDNNKAIKDKYPIKIKIFNDDLEVQQDVY